MDDNNLSSILSLIAQDKLTEIEAERLINAFARLDSGTPTGVARVPENKTHTH